MKREVVFILILFMSFSFASAVWWNPVDWFEKSISLSPVDGCSDLDQVIINEIRDLIVDGKNIVLTEGDAINKSFYFVIPEEGGKIFKVDRIINSSSSSYGDDEISLIEVLSEQSYDVFISAEGKGIVGLFGETYNIDYYGSSVSSGEEKYIKIDYPQTSGEDKTSFVDCPDKVIATCEDNEGEKNYNVKGSIETELSTYEDICLNFEYLTEWFCEGDLGVSESYKCPEDCRDGACINDQTIWCSENDYCGTVGGFVGMSFCENDAVYRNSSFIECINPGTPESYCADESTIIKVFQYDCSGGCVDGICIGGEVICEDSDGGIDYDVKGTVNYEGIATDYCLSDGTTLKEMYCIEDFTLGILDYTCPEICGNGACIKNPDNCSDDCFEGQIRPCDFGRTKICGNFDADNCLEFGECAFEPIHPPQIRSGNLDGIRSEDTFSSQVGSILEISSQVWDRSNAEIKEVYAEIILNEEVIFSTDLDCIQDDDPEENFIYFCSSINDWHALDVIENEFAFYTLRITAIDNLEQSSSFDKEYSIIFRSSSTELCKELIEGHNNLEENRANLVFLGYGYEGYESKTPEELLKTISKKLVDLEENNQGLFSFTPFKENKEKFNFWYIDQTISIDFCSERGNCEDPEFLAGNCAFNNKYLTKVVDKNFRSHANFRTGIIDLSSKIYPPRIEEYYCSGEDIGEVTFTCFSCIEGTCLDEPSLIEEVPDSCTKLSNDIKLKIENLQESEKNIALEENMQIDDSNYFVIPTISGGKIFRLGDISNRSLGYRDDEIRLTDDIDGSSYYPRIVSEGRGILYIGVEEFFISYYDYYDPSDYSDSEYIVVTWGEGASYENAGSQTETFFECTSQDSSCSDSDINSTFPDGINIYQKGTTTDGILEYEDYCIPEGPLIVDEILKLEIGFVDPRTFTHEFGHSFGDLQDEYITQRDNSPPSSQPPGLHNCYTGSQHTQVECLEETMWNHLIGDGCGQDNIIDCSESDLNFNFEIGCFEGCSAWEFGAFRSARDTIMRSAFSENTEFGLWNEELLMEEINKFI